MYLVEFKAERTDPSGPPELAIAAHRASHPVYTSAAPTPAGTAGCRPLYLLHLLNLSITTWAAYSIYFRAYRSFVYASSLVLLGAKAKFLCWKPKVVAALDEMSEIC